MDNSNAQPDIFIIRRKTPRSRGFSWGGTVSFGACLAVSAQLCYYSLTFRDISGANAFRFGILIALFFVIAIILWVVSSKSQNGTLSISDELISCKCERNFLDIMPGQVTSVTRYDDIVKIAFSGKTLTVKSEKASQIEDRVKDFISAYRYSGNLVTTVPTPVAVRKTESQNELISADKIREYKKLVDDGIISQEQFDQIIEKITQK